MGKKWTAGPCPVCARGRTFHEDCLFAAILWVSSERYETDMEPTVVRRLAKICYLCGTARSTDAEHVHPKSRGGSDLWTNMAGACVDCNLAKRAKVDSLNEEQRIRAAEHQTLFRAAFARCTVDMVVEGVKYRGFYPEDFMEDGLLDLSLTEEQAMRFFPDGHPDDLDDGNSGVVNSKYGFIVRL